MPTHHLSPEEISRRLAMSDIDNSQFEPTLVGLSNPPTPAAVLIPMFRRRQDWHLLFIRRSANPQDRHSGEVAFPGGRMETSDPDPEGTALRETWEEIGLPAGDVSRLGRLAALRTASNYLVHPFVGQIDAPLNMRPAPREVARIFSIPLDWLADNDNHAEHDWQPPGQREKRKVVIFRDYDGERLWGVSARITLSLLKVLR